MTDVHEDLEDLDRTVGVNIRSLREIIGITQKDLADRLGNLGWTVDATAVTRIEKGNRALRVSQLALIAEALGSTPSELLFGSQDAVRIMYNTAITGLTSARRSLDDAALMLTGLLWRYESDDPVKVHQVLSLGLSPEEFLDQVRSVVSERRSAWVDTVHGGRAKVLEQHEAGLARIIAEVTSELYSVVPTKDETDGQHPEAS